VPTCPFCAEPVKAEAAKCPWCQSDLGSGESALVEKIRKWQRGPEEAAPPRRRFSIGFWISTILVAGLIAIPLLTSKRPSDAGGAACAIAFLFAWIPLIFFCLDVSRIYPESCSTPERALRGFAQALRRKNWKLAREFVAAPDLESSEPRMTPEQVKATPPKGSFAFAGDGFVRYWKHLVSRADTRPRWARATAGDSRSLGSALAEGELRVDIQSYSIWAFLFFGLIGYFVTLQTARYRFRKLLIQKGRRWYLANGECSDSGDQDLAERIR